MSLIPWRNKRESRDLERVSPRALPRLRDQIDELFDRFMHDFWSEGPHWLSERGFGFSTRADLAETDDEVTVKMDLPGVEPKDVDISLEGNVLTIRGEKKEEKEEKKRDYHYVERQFGSFHRSIQLPSTVDPEKVDATFKNGVLTVTVAKRADAKAKRIEVKTA